MILVILTALAAVCGATKLDTSYLPPISAKTAGGSPGALLTPFDGSYQGLPTGSYTNDAQGVVVDAVNPGTRTSGLEPTGLGGPRTSYGSTNSKVGNAAFRGPAAGLSGSGPRTRIAPGFGSFVGSDESQADKTSGNTLKFTSDVGLENYSYGFETDNGITVGENGDAVNGVKAQGGYSYKGDDGKTYSISYTADEGGYKPQGQHLPTPPPIPNEILISLEKNSKEEAAGHVDDGSYNAQKYNDEGDYSSNGAGNNNGRPTIGGGDSMSTGTYVSQSNRRPTSGVLVGTYNPGSLASHSSQGHGAQGFGQNSEHKQSSLNAQSGTQSLLTSGDIFSNGQSEQTGSKDTNVLNHDQFSYHGQSGLQSTGNRFSIQATKFEGNHAHAQASVAGSPAKSPSFHNLPISSAYSSAVSSGSGSASAFASTGSLSSGLKNEYISSSNSVGSASQSIHGSKYGSDSSAGSSVPAPSTATASAFVPGSGTLDSYKHSQPPNSPPSASASAFVSGNQNSYSHSNKPFNGFNSESNAFPSRFGEGQQSGNTASNTEYLPPVNTASSVKQTHNSKPHGFDMSVASAANVQPLSQHNSQSQYGSTDAQLSSAQPTQASFGFGSNQGPTKVPDIDLQSSNQVLHSSSHTGTIDATYASSTQKPLISQQQGSDNSYYYKPPSKPFITPSITSNTQYSKNNQQIISTSTLPQKGTIHPNTLATLSTGQYQGTSSSSYNGITQAAISSFPSDSSLSSTQFASQSSHFGQKPSIQFGQSSQAPSIQFGSTETHSGQKPIVQSQTEFGLSSNSQNFASSQSPTQQYQGTIYQYNKPDTTLPTQEHKDTSSSFGQGTIVQNNLQAKPGQIDTDSRFGTQQSSSQFGGAATSQYSSKPKTSQGSSFSYSQSQSQFEKKPVSTIQTNVATQQTQSGSGFQFGQNSQFSQGLGLVLTTAKPIDSSYQLTQFGTNGSKFGSTSSQFGQNSQSTVGSGTVSTNTKPIGSSYQQTQFRPTGSKFGSTSSQFGQNSQSTQGSGTVSTNSKPIGSSYQQTQFGPTGSKFGTTSTQFGQNSQSTQGSGLVSTTVKPVGTFSSGPYAAAISQYSSKPQTSQGSDFSYSQSQSQFEKKPVSTTQTGVATQQTQSGSGFQFGQNSQSSQGLGLVSTTAKPIGSSYQQTQFGSNGSKFGSTSSQFGQITQSTLGSGTVSTTKPIGSSYQQTQFRPTGSKFGSTSSQFGQNSQSTQGSGTVSTNTKPIGSSYQQAQFGSNGSKFGTTSTQFGQNSQSTQGSGLVSTTVKPVGTFSSGPYAAAISQYSSKPQTSQGSNFSYSQSQSQFEKKPFSTTQTGVATQQTQSGSSFQFGQNSQSSQGLGLVSTTAKPIGSSYQQTQFGSTGSKFGSTGSQVGQNSQSTQDSGTVLTNTKPIASSYQQTQFGPTGSKLGTTCTLCGQNSQSTQGSGIVSTNIKPISSSYQQAQFGSNGSKFGTTSTQFGQNSQSTQGSGLVSTTVKPVGTFSSGPYAAAISQYSSKPQTSQGSNFSYSQSQSQFEKKPFSTTQTGVATQQTQSGSGFQFGQNSQSSQGLGLVSTTAKPIGSSYQQTQFGSNGSKFGSTSSQFGQITQSTLGSGTISTTKPIGSSYQRTQFRPTGSKFGSTSSQFGQNSQSTQGSGTVSTNTKPIGSSYQQTQFGPSGSKFGTTSTQFGQNSQSTQGSGLVSTTVKPVGTFSSGPYAAAISQYSSKPQTSQGSNFSYSQSQSQLENKPVSTAQTGVATQQTQSGSSFQFGQNSQSSQGLGLVSTTAKPIGSSYQQTQFGSTGSKFGSTGSQVGQNSQSTQDSGTVSTNTKPIASSYQQTQFGPTGSKLGTTCTLCGQNSQSTQGSGLVSTNIKPISSSYQQTQFGSTGSKFVTTSSQHGHNSQSAIGVGLVSTPNQPFSSQKPIGLTSQQAQFGLKPQKTQGSSFAYSQVSSQASQLGEKPHNPTQTSLGYQQIQYGSSVSQLSQKSQSNVGTSSVLPTTKPLFSQNPLSSSFQQTQISTTGSRFGQNPQSSLGTGSVSITPKPLTGSSYQQTQFGTQSQTSQGFSYGPQTGSISQLSLNSQSTGVGSVSTTTKPSHEQKPFGTANPGFGSAASSNQFGSGTDYFPSQTFQFDKKPLIGTLQTGNSASSQSTQKPLVSFLSQTNNQQQQYTQTANKVGSQPLLGEVSHSNVGSGQVGLTTFGLFRPQSTQTTYQQTQFNKGQNLFSSTQGSVSHVGQSIEDQPTQGTFQTANVDGYNYQKPQSVITTQHGGVGIGTQDQKVQQSQSNFNSAVSTSQVPINAQPLKPFGTSSTQGTLQSQSTVSPTQFGTDLYKPSDFSGPVVQTSYNEFNGQPFKPLSSTSTQGSNSQSQSTAVSTSQFGPQPTKPAGIVYFGGQPFQSATHGSSSGSQSVVGSIPEYSIHPSHGVVLPSQKPSHISVEPYNPSIHGSTPVPNAPSRVGSNAGLVVSTVQFPIVHIPGYEIATSNQGPANGFVGAGEEFGGPRDPPRFDDKTGYHY